MKEDRRGQVANPSQNAALPVIENNGSLLIEIMLCATRVLTCTVRRQAIDPAQDIKRFQDPYETFTHTMLLVDVQYIAILERARKAIL